MSGFEELGRDLPTFAPTLSANAAVAFASLLAAISLSVSVQVVFQDARRARETQSSVWLAVMSFATLVISAYTYVRLAGRPDQVSGVVDRFRVAKLLNVGDLTADANAFAGEGQVAAGLFIVAGTLLATGAIGVLGVLVLTVLENSATISTRKLVVVAYDGGAAVTAVYLLSGMWDIGRIRALEEGRNGPTLEGFGWEELLMVGLTGVALGLGGLLLSRRELASRRADGSGVRTGARQRPSSRAARWLVPRLCVLVYWVMPVAIGIWVDTSKDGRAAPLWVDVLSMCIAYGLFFIVVGGIRGLLAHRLADPLPDPGDEIRAALESQSRQMRRLIRGQHKATRRAASRTRTKTPAN